ncbi:uncharacterized protein LOC144110478 [Amblyomma americanum]
MRAAARMQVALASKLRPLAVGHLQRLLKRRSQRQVATGKQVASATLHFWSRVRSQRRRHSSRLAPSGECDGGMHKKHGGRSNTRREPDVTRSASASHRPLTPLPRTLLRTDTLGK